MKNKIVIDKNDLSALIGYIHTLLDFIDVDDLTPKNRSLVVDGYDDFVNPCSPTSNNFESPFAYANKINVEIFKENLEDIYKVDISKLSNEDVEEIYDEVEALFGDDETCYGIYNDYVWKVLKKHQKTKYLIQ